MKLKKAFQNMIKPFKNPYGDKDSHEGYMNFNPRVKQAMEAFKVTYTAKYPKTAYEFIEPALLKTSNESLKILQDETEKLFEIAKTIITFNLAAITVSVTLVNNLFVLIPFFLSLSIGLCLLLRPTINKLQAQNNLIANIDDQVAFVNMAHQEDVLYSPKRTAQGLFKLKDPEAKKIEKNFAVDIAGMYVGGICSNKHKQVINFFMILSSIIFLVLGLVLTGMFYNSNPAEPANGVCMECGC